MTRAKAFGLAQKMNKSYTNNKHNCQENNKTPIKVVNRAEAF